MPHSDWPDEQERAVPFDTVLATESSVNTGGGYTVPGLSGQTVVGYRSLAVTVDGGGTDVSVEVGWRIDGSAAGTVPTETKSGGGAHPVTLLFVNQGHTLDHVTLTGGGGVDYSVAESNQLPLPASGTPATVARMYGTLYDIPFRLPSVGEDQNNWFTFTLDTGSFHGSTRDVTDVNTFRTYFTTLLRLGPFGSIWEISSRYNVTNTNGKLRFQLASVAEDWPGAGFHDNTAVVQGSALDGATYVSFPASETEDMSAPVAVKNVRNSRNPQFRLMGADGAALTAFTVPPFPERAYYTYDADGGAGLYRLKALVDGAGSTGGKFGGQLVELVVRRTDYYGF